MALCWVNGSLVDAGRPALSPLDRGVLYGDGIFETMRVYAGRVFALEAHLRRLEASAGTLGLPLQYSCHELTAAVSATLQGNGVSDAYLRLTVTRGVGGQPAELEASAACTVIVTARAFSGYPARVYTEGMRLIFALARRNETSSLSRIKSLNYLDNVLELRRARAAGLDEVVFLNTQGRVAEGAITNLFIGEGGRFVTPPVEDGALPGIVRALIMERLDAVEESIAPERLARADEVVLTNSLLEVAAAVELDGRPIGAGRPGPGYAEARAAYEELVQRQTQARL